MSDHYKQDNAAAINAVAQAGTAIANALTPINALGLQTPNGGHVGSLTEAVVYAAENLGRIADAIQDLADAVRERES